MTCPRCEGEGWFLLILKARSVGISTLCFPSGTKVECPDCKGTGKLNS